MLLVNTCCFRKKITKLWDQKKGALKESEQTEQNKFSVSPLYNKTHLIMFKCRVNFKLQNKVVQLECKKRWKWSVSFSVSILKCNN